MRLIPDTPIGKKQFLIEHNKLSPENLQVTFEMLTDFQEAKKPLLNDADWSNKLRMPLITWLIALPQLSQKKKKNVSKSKKSEYMDYPETKS